MLHELQESEDDESVNEELSEGFKSILSHIEHLMIEIMDKLKFAMSLSEIYSNNQKGMNNELSGVQMCLVKKAFNNCMNKEENNSKFNRNQERNAFLKLKSPEKREHFFNSYRSQDDLVSRDDCSVSKAFEICYKNKGIRELSSSCQLSKSALNFLKNIEYLFDMTAVKMNVTPKDEMMTEKHLRKMNLENEELTKECVALKQLLLDDLMRDLTDIQGFKKDIDSQRDRIVSAKKQCQNAIKKSGDDVEEIMVFHWKASDDKQDSIIDKINVSEVGNLELIKQKNAAEEKEQRVKRYKTEQQLLAVLEQYDKDLQDSLNKCDRDMKVYEKEKEIFDRLKKAYYEQTIEYNILMAEKRLYERLLVEGKAFEMRCNIAAKKIQWAFKTYMEKKKQEDLRKYF